MASDGFQIMDSFDVTTNSNTCCWTRRREYAKETNTWSLSFTLAMLQVWKNKRRGEKEPKVRVCRQESSRSLAAAAEQRD